MKKTAFIMVSVFFLLVSAIWSRAESLSIGIVRSVLNEAYIVRNGEAKTATINMKVMKGDLIRTGPEGSLGLIFDDDTVVSMGPDSEFTIEGYLFQPAEKKLSFVARLFKGTYSFLSGQIAKLAPDSVRIETPDATIGMRGTHFLVQVEGR